MNMYTDIPTAPPLPILGGHLPGPTLAVAGAPDVLRALACALAKIPTLPRMRGVLVLGMAPDISVDSSVIVDEPDAPIQTIIWRVLAEAARLGMISGRGVPRRFLDAA
jgi:hypothetical protein